MSKREDIPISKGDFAKRLGVSRKTVQSYIRTGKIAGRAIVGEGREARIRPEIAMAQLRRHNVHANLGEAPVVAGVKVTRSKEEVALTQAIQRERLRALKLKNNRAQAEFLIRTRKFILADKIEGMLGRFGAEMMSVLDTIIAAVVSEAAEHRDDMSGRELTIHLRKVSNEIRAEAAARAAAHAATLPEFVDYDFGAIGNRAPNDGAA